MANEIISLQNFIDFDLVARMTILFIVLGFLIAIIMYFMHMLSFKDLVVAKHITQDKGTVVKMHRGKKVGLNSKDGRVEAYKVFRFLKKSLLVPVYESKHSTPLFGKKGFLVEYVVLNDSWASINSKVSRKRINQAYTSVDGNISGVEKVYTIDNDVRDWQASMTRQANEEYNTKSWLEKHQAIVAVGIVAVAFIVMVVFHSETINAILGAAPNAAPPPPAEPSTLQRLGDAAVS